LIVDHFHEHFGGLTVTLLVTGERFVDDVHGLQVMLRDELVLLA
jgi:hypothetical protein